ncbi:MAG: sigma-70 family RNA polymerase sigma factor [Planctomycetes bacterium]|nr:sigma-70 family RNA polymerase sigma factor [Planctomycetota bacterium]
MSGEANLHGLVEKAQGGQREAFDELYRLCREKLEHHVQTRLGRHLRSKVDAEDVLQEAFVQAWKSIGRLEWAGEGAFFQWLKGIAEHAILNLANRGQTPKLFFLEHDLPASQPSPSRALRRGERFDRLQEALDSLSPDYREAVHLVRIEGLKIKEAAERMNRTPKAVMHLLERALKKLKDSFGDTESLGLPARPLQNPEHPGGACDSG